MQVNMNLNYAGKHKWPHWAFIPVGIQGGILSLHDYTSTKRFEAWL